MKWYLKVLKHYADFSGRARRKEYWMFVLFNMIFLIVAIILDNVLGLTVDDSPFGVFYFLYGFAIVIPALAVNVRRLQDVGKSGWWFLIIFVPFIGPVWLFVLLVIESQQGYNKWGQNPKEISADKGEEE